MLRPETDVVYADRRIPRCGSRCSRLLQNGETVETLPDVCPGSPAPKPCEVCGCHVQPFPAMS